MNTQNQTAIALLACAMSPTLGFAVDAPVPATPAAKPVAPPPNQTGPFVFENKTFDAPKMIMVQGRPMSGALPSPALIDIDGDGRNEMLVGSVTGSLTAYTNKSTGSGEPQWGMGSPLKDTSGKPIVVNNWCCVGMTPQEVDLNGDGFKDLIMGCFEGVPKFIEGSKDGFLPPVSIKDSSGQDVILEEFYDSKKGWIGSDRAGGKGHCTSAAMVDWDGDGDPDLILGDKKGGGVYLRMNEGSATKPSFSLKNLEVLADGKLMVCKDGLATPRIVDWDGDGLFDIMCGGIQGGVYFFKNIGKKGQPSFAAAECLIQPLVRYIYQDVVPVHNGQPAMPGAFYQIEPYDYDGDGDLDLLIGSLSNWANPAYKELSAEAKKDVEAMQKKAADMAAAFPKGEEWKKYIQTKEGKARYAEFIALQNSSNKATNKAVLSGNFVWLFKNKQK